MLNLTSALDEINIFAEKHCVGIRIFFEWMGSVRLEMVRDEYKVSRIEKIDIFEDNVDAVRVFLENMVREIDMRYDRPITLPIRDREKKNGS